ncbi:glutamine synthetase III family protein [Intestinibacter bartlettii]|uniref:glutamine synthetase III family protein n=1 Tax=Intestinibacter bartlettii TaxID=261299 RepID=UPI001D12009E|nr:glutamine synthetase III [Intestinibacter bartlettii]MCC2705523.1 glutamine synthetase III [Intestinibacter bartlettii]MCC2760973.1 glutamine synthetase III [Intestinibacter bartlettii]
MTKVPEIFGSLVFNEAVMKDRLPKDVYKALQNTIKNGEPIDLKVANVVANAMKDWAIEHGATHFTHWFQPMTGITAEKHDSFISPTDDGKVIMEFSGKELVKGEPDGSSFPSGGLRSTFEARGYTVWDPTSFAYLRNGTLCIPTAFCSYGGQVLDKKTPLLKSMEAINKSAVRLLHLLGETDVKRISTTVGPEQEYFLIDKGLYNKRIDLKFTGRTLFGAKPPKGQELDDHYFGAIKPRVVEYMKDLDEELWKLGVLAKTKHNEVAPAQHELAPIFTTTNVATDHNQLTMDVMKKVACKHGLMCLLHEKPFAGVNGSGKHNNWSISTDTGKNILNPGKDPIHNKVFLTFLIAIVKAVHENQDLLRISVADAGNDHRLGGNEAPPAILSMFIGTDLEKVLKCVEEDLPYNEETLKSLEIDVNVLPSFKKDTTDRNRTSPFAFTGNKFEFRMLGSTANIACPNTILNTIVAESLDYISDYIEGKDDLDKALNEVLKKILKEHKAIIFNGNNYAPEWVEEAESRGLLNLKSSAEALPHYTDEKNIKLFEKHGVYTKLELESRKEILLEKYCQTINIEALTMLEMVKKDIIPAICNYSKDLTQGALAKKNLSSDIDVSLETSLVSKISSLSACLSKKTAELDKVLLDAKDIEDSEELAKFYHDTVLSQMNEVRAIADELETIVGKGYWPFPTYTDLLFSV